VITTRIKDWKELASRENGGLEVALLWSRSADRVMVSVADARLGEEFDFNVASTDALAAFNHPFAYAPPQSFGSLEVDCESPNLRQLV
jgi:hypothetical protein